MRGEADIQVVARVEMAGEENVHLRDIMRRVRNYNPNSVKSRLELSDADRRLLDEFDSAQTEANVKADMMYNRIMPSNNEQAEPDPFE